MMVFDLENEGGVGVEKAVDVYIGCLNGGVEKVFEQDAACLYQEIAVDGDKFPPKEHEYGDADQEFDAEEENALDTRFVKAAEKTLCPGIATYNEFYPGKPYGDDKDDVDGLPGVVVGEFEPFAAVVQCADNGEAGQAEDVDKVHEGESQENAQEFFPEQGGKGEYSSEEDRHDLNGAAFGYHDKVETVSSLFRLCFPFLLQLGAQGANMLLNLFERFLLNFWVQSLVTANSVELGFCFPDIGVGVGREHEGNTGPCVDRFFSTTALFGTVRPQFPFTQRAIIGSSNFCGSRFFLAARPCCPGGTNVSRIIRAAAMAFQFTGIADVGKHLRGVFGNLKEEPVISAGVNGVAVACQQANYRDNEDTDKANGVLARIIVGRTIIACSCGGCITDWRPHGS